MGPDSRCDHGRISQKTDGRLFHLWLCTVTATGTLHTLHPHNETLWHRSYYDPYIHIKCWKQRGPQGLLGRFLKERAHTFSRLPPSCSILVHKMESLTLGMEWPDQRHRRYLESWQIVSLHMGPALPTSKLEFLRETQITLITFHLLLFLRSD